MTENGKSTEAIPTAFRLPRKRRLQLEIISKEREHKHLSETLNEAVAEYIAAYLRRDAA